MKKFQKGFLLNPFRFGMPEPPESSMILHLPGNGANGGTTFTDVSPIARTPDSVISTVVTDTANPRFGTSSMNFTSGRIVYADSTDWEFGAGEFLIRFWFKLNSSAIGTSARVFFFGQATSLGGDGSFSLVKNTSDRLEFNFIHSSGTVSIVLTAVTLTANTWYWCEISRTGDNIYLSLDGSSFVNGDVTGLSLVNSSAKFAVGGLGKYTGGGYGGATGERMMGWLADFQMYKGVGGHTSAFTPPTTEL